MKLARPALRYAKAVLNLAKDTKVASEVNKDMLFIAETIKGSSDLQAVLESPVIKATDKIKVLRALFKDQVNNISLGLFNLLAENKRIVMLESIAKQYTIIYNFYKRKQTAKVTTAVPLTKDLEAKILEKVIALTGNTVAIENTVNADILGGFIIRVADVQYDASISNHLNELRKEFDNSHYIPKI